MLQELHEIHVGRAILDHGVSLFPLWVGGPAVTGYDWSPTSIAFEEVEGGATVDTLEATNTAGRPAVALEGDLAEGGWQHRMVARSVAIAPGERRPVSVLCVEQGRWHGSTSFGRRGRRVSATVRAASRRGSDAQLEVWQSIQHLDRQFTGSPTRSLTHHLDEAGAPSPRMLDGQRGVVIGVAGRILGAELFASVAGLRSRWEGIVEGARLDARRADWIPTQAETARQFARIVEGLELVRTEQAGLGSTVVGQRGPVRASGIAAMVAQREWMSDSDANRILHLSLINQAHPLLVSA